MMAPPMVISDLVRVGVSGGTAFDGLVEIAAEHDAPLLTLNGRASATHERLATPFLIIA